MLPTRDVAPRALVELLKRQPTSEPKVRFAWQSCVGSSMARATSVHLDEAGTLTVITDTDTWRNEVRRSLALIRGRLGGLLGTGTVKRIVVKRRAEP